MHAYGVEHLKDASLGIDSHQVHDIVAANLPRIPRMSSQLVQLSI